ncbi:MAG: hypothetical protein CO119_06645 [Flavobacteriales bacterium CG_4_9_14_3_um_filter_40_17]|nr:MAG: hypothetical protein CO119_06645 [Flavobacteriales bacterium CG_4_9_14_3_um_filter_40_17]
MNCIVHFINLQGIKKLPDYGQEAIQMFYSLVYCFLLEVLMKHLVMEIKKAPKIVEALNVFTTE